MSKQTINKEIEDLVSLGMEIYKDFAAEAQGEENQGLMGNKYEGWYSKAERVVDQVLPSRADDFRSHYTHSKVRKTIDYENFFISDFLQGTVVKLNGQEKFDPTRRAFSRFQLQLQILISAKESLNSKLIDLEGVLLAMLFDDEIDKARSLAKHKLLRESGVISGVVLEGHLANVARSHKLKISNKNPDIATLNDTLKKEGVYDTPTWRFIQRLGDIRNLCDHKKEREPTKDEVLELADGVDKIIKTVA